MKKVAIENSLQNVKAYLQEKGYTVDSLENNKQNINSFDAIIVSGQDSNVLGMEDTFTKGSIISAQGLTPENIYNELENKLK